jgi:hypothetical protein
MPAIVTVTGPGAALNTPPRTGTTVFVLPDSLTVTAAFVNGVPPSKPEAVPVMVKVIGAAEAALTDDRKTPRTIATIPTNTRGFLKKPPRRNKPQGSSKNVTSRAVNAHASRRIARPHHARPGKTFGFRLSVFHDLVALAGSMRKLEASLRPELPT